MKRYVKDNEITHPKTMLIAISMYQYLILIQMSMFLLIIPVIEPHQYFDTLFEDIFVRCILWLYLVGSCWSIANGIKKAINKEKGLFFVSRKNITSLVLLSISAVVTSVVFIFLMNWSLSAFVPQIPGGIIFIISLGNGLIYATLGMSQYYFFPTEK